MTPQEIIRRKRDGGTLSSAEIGAFVDGAVDGGWTRAQCAALLMAVYQHGLDGEETSSLTEAMRVSGEVLELAAVPGPKADKHSTGGVGDKVSLILAPAAAACGLKVPMLSGRGLGHTGGTLDKLEAIPGFSVGMSPAAIRSQLADIGCVMAGQTEALVPADRLLYGLRDETATVEELSLIASSIMSKKLAEDIDALVMDIKIGRGAFLPDLAKGRELARMIVGLGEAAGCRTAALLSSMDAPLGRCIGNALEVREALEVLRGGGPADLGELSVKLVAMMLRLTSLAPSLAEGEERVRTVLADGGALACFRAMVEAQGGDARVIENPDLLPAAKHVLDIHYEGEKPAHVAKIDAREVAGVVLQCGAGRLHAAAPVNPATGLSSLVAEGETVEPGSVLARLHVDDTARLEEWSQRIRAAITLSAEKVPVNSRVLELYGIETEDD
ncbi:MAG: thymidine phosphorylase [Verrucomicrobia bacterium]|jgi:pyrimidine-nucleoside phosphorylase|nr:thymidine phosphorylase [Verrucomicrobiota bacterium]